jgi:thiol-disulfide isomerase/thioredoxin
VKLMKLILVGGIVCLYGIGAAGGDSSKAINISAVQWVTQNPPTSEDLVSSVHVIEFWATWCGPCIKQVPHIKSLTKEYEDRNVIFIGLSVDQSIDTVRKFVKKNNINYHIGMDNGLTDDLDVSGVPRAFIISHEGKILWSGNPGDKGFMYALKSAVNAAPEAMLAGVDLGQFSYLRIKLRGGKNFAKAYSELEDHAKNGDSSEKICADNVLQVINTKIREKIAAAQRLRDKDPKTALQMYKEIIDNYSGINLTIEVESIYQQLQKQTATNTPTPAVISAKATAG